MFNRRINVNIDEIETFLCIAEVGSFSNAAAKLNRTQPAISRRIQMLEESLGDDLFLRDGKAASLTLAGRVFLPYAETIMATIVDGRRAVEALQDDYKGTRILRVAVVGTLADTFLVNALRKFEKRVKGVNVNLRTATSAEVSEFVRRGEVDVGLRYFNDKSPRIICHEIGVEKLLVTVAAEHELAGKELRNLKPLKDENWLSFPKHRNQPDSFGYLLERQLISAGLTDTQLTFVDSLTAQKRLIQAGFGITLMPISSIKEELAAGSLATITVKQLKAQQPISIVRRAEGFQNELMDQFLESLITHMESIFD